MSEYILTDCSNTAVQAKINDAGTVDGDIITLNCSGTWSTTITLNKAITIKGNTPTLGVDGIPTSCPTVITDTTPNGTHLVSSFLVAGKATRISAIKFQGTVDNFAEALSLTSCNNGSSFRMDHTIWDSLHRGVMVPYSVMGVVDHNHIIEGSTAPAPVLVGHVWGPFYDSCGVNDYGDGSMAAGIQMGTDQLLYFENNKITNSSSTRIAAIDCQNGARWVWRYNVSDKASIECHGHEGAARYRGPRTVEIYRNTATGNDTTQTWIFLRGASGVVWDNDVTGWTANSNFGMVNYMLQQNNPFPTGGSDGRNPWDVNHASNPFATGTCSSAGALNCTVSGTPYTAHQWIGYTIRRTSGKVITSLTQSGGVISGTTSTDHGFVTNDVITIWGADQYGYNNAFTVQSTPTTATFTLSDLGFNLPSPSTGTRQCAKGSSFAMVDDNTTNNITYSAAVNAGYDMVLASGDTFEINKVIHSMDEPGFGGGSDLGGAVLPAIPGGWNNQSVDGWYEWNNVRESANLIHFSNGRSGSCNGLCTFYTLIENSTYWNYTTSFDGTVGVGRGTRASRPATCTAGVAYWSTDQGSWNISGSGAQGVLDKCTATNTWTNSFYVPYTYPHPLATDDAQPSAGYQIVTIFG